MQDLLSKGQTERAKLGVLAINGSLMTSVQVEEVHNEQRRTDRRFGEIAVERGYLTDEQVTGLLKKQKESSVQLGQMLVDSGLFTLEMLEKSLKAYKQASQLNDDQFQAIQQGNVEEIVKAFVNVKDGEQGEALQNYVGLFFRNLIRFVDAEPMLLKSEDIDSDQVVTVTQKITGSLALETFLVMEEKLFVKLAEVFGKLPVKEMGELAEASVSELLNLHNGIFAVNMSEQGKPVELLPPEMAPHTDFSGKLTVPFQLSFGRIYLVLC